MRTRMFTQWVIRIPGEGVFFRALCVVALAIFGFPATGCSEDDDFSVFLAGDMIVMRPLSDVEDDRFLRLVRQIREADAAVVNSETLFHRFKGYAQAQSDGTYMATSPAIANDLAWAGIDMVSTANNHAFDYGSEGVIENLENLAKSQILTAGTGADLQRARAPTYFYHPRRTVALISAVSTFVPSTSLFKIGKASRSRPDMRGRPGLNPLASPDDEKANLSAIIEASRTADLIIFSIHAHKQGKWLTDFAHQAIDAGADVFFAHGPHEIRGIEIYKNRPIFYSLGNFFYEPYFVERLPSELFDKYGLGDSATVQDLMAVRMRKTLAKRKAWESLGAVVRFKNHTLHTIELIPLDLGFGKAVSERGRPLFASSALGREIIAVVKSKSEAYGTEVEYQQDNIGLITND